MFNERKTSNLLTPARGPGTRVKEKTMKGYRKIETAAQNRGLVITCGPATNWIGSLNKAEQWCGGNRAQASRMHAYSYVRQGCVVEPTTAYPNLRSLKEAVLAQAENREARFYV
jgi:hypothetical protein